MDIFSNAQEAFEHYYDKIIAEGVDFNGTKALFNVNFTITNPMDNEINTEWRKWSKKYAERELAWYISKNPSVEELQKYAPIWKRMHSDRDCIVQSNYGLVLSENRQLQKCIEELKSKPDTRQAFVSIFDGKRKEQYMYDTPCTLAIGFYIVNGKLDCTVMMRSNDVIYGLCNDIYAFTYLQKYVADNVGVPVGEYHHFDVNLHCYYDKIGMKDEYYKNLQ